MTWPSLKPFCIGGEADPYLKRWFILPRNKVFCIYLHQMLRDDDHRALHDHPGDNLSIVLKGGYDEVLFEYWRVLYKPVSPAGRVLPQTYIKRRWPGQIIWRSASMPHQLALWPGAKSSWSLFVMWRKRREWGFWCGPVARWVPWQEFTAGDHGELIGKGCG